MLLDGVSVFAEWLYHSASEPGRAHQRSAGHRARAVSTVMFRFPVGIWESRLGGTSITSARSPIHAGEILAGELEEIGHVFSLRSQWRRFRW